MRDPVTGGQLLRDQNDQCRYSPVHSLQSCAAGAEVVEADRWGVRQFFPCRATGKDRLPSRGDARAPSIHTCVLYPHVMNELISAAMGFSGSHDQFSCGLRQIWRQADVSQHVPAISEEDPEIPWPEEPGGTVASKHFPEHAEVILEGDVGKLNASDGVREIVCAHVQVFRLEGVWAASSKTLRLVPGKQPHG